MWVGKSKVKVSVVRNALAKKALAGSPVEPLFPLMVGNSALVYGGSSVVEIARLQTEEKGAYLKP